MKQTKRNLKQILVSILCLIVLVFTGCSKTGDSTQNKGDGTHQPTYITRTLIKLNTVVTINIYDKQEDYLLDGAMEICDYYEKIFSRTSEESELYKFNHGLLNTATDGTNQAELSEDLVDLITLALNYCNLSSGKFDLTVAPLADLWNFTAENPQVPADSEIKALLPYINYKDVTVDNRTVTINNLTTEIDLGAIAKGYIADRIKEYLVNEGVKSATINLGGNVLCIGEKPDHTPFNIGIQKPFANRNELISLVGINDMSVVSSGIYERCFTANDKFYHHILNPSTGYPYETDLISVTIISKYSVDGDGLSTSCFALGLEDGMKLINSLEDTYAVFITSDYELHYSDGFFENLEVTPVEEQ